MSAKILEHNARGQTAVEGNELFQDSSIDDAAAMRIGGPNGGKLSWDRLPDGIGGTRREIALMTAGEGWQGPEWKLILLKKGGQTADADQVTVMEATAEGLEIKVPVKGLQGPEGRFYHEGGRFCTVHQNDGHVVTYDTRVEPWRPLWGNWEGNIVPPPWL